MRGNAKRWAVLDSVLASSGDRVPRHLDWLLAQTLATAGARRALFPALGLGPGTVLDVGCGLGAAVLEVAAMAPASVIGIDTSTASLAFAAETAARVAGAGGVHPGATSAFLVGSAYDLPLAKHSVDAAMARFVFQHLAGVDDAADEIARVLRPGGLVCVIDVDDGLSLSEPPPSTAWTELANALTAAQTGAGGDRRIGRKLAALLDRHGLHPVNVLVLPQASYRRSAGPEPVMVKRLLAARDAIVAGGHLTAERFDACLEEYRSAADGGPVFEVDAHLAVVARAGQ